MWVWKDCKSTEEFWKILFTQGLTPGNRLLLREILVGSGKFGDPECYTMIPLFDDKTGASNLCPYIPNHGSWQKNCRPIRGRFDTVDYIMNILNSENISGDIIETGVWRGGMAIYLSYLAAGRRRVFLADSFEGCDSPENAVYSYDKEIHRKGQHAASLTNVVANIQKFRSAESLLSVNNNIRFIPGYFKDTLTQRPIKSIEGTPLEKIALLRFDADTYSATLEVLNNLYDLVVPGGFVIIDDYCVDTCRVALLKWLKDYPEIQLMHPTTYEPFIVNEKDFPCGVWWRKEQNKKKEEKDKDVKEEKKEKIEKESNKKE